MSSDGSEESDSLSDESIPSIVPDSMSDLEPDHYERERDYASDNSGCFDTNLPATHAYLGHLNAISGYTVFDDYDEIIILAIFTDSLVVPGFTLPLVLTHYSEQQTVKKYLAQSKTLGLVFADVFDPSLMFNYGVTMEVFESYSRGHAFHLKAKGRQRFQVIEADREQMTFSMSRLKKLKVRILPEPLQQSPMAASELKCLNRCKIRMTDYESQMKNKAFRKYESMQFTFPLWLYDQCEVYYYVNEIKKAFEKSNITVPTDPIKLSYWFLQNFQLEHGERLEVMKLETALQRLRLELHYLKMRRVLCCRTCNEEIADQVNVFAMSKEGIQSNYCNPGGYVYETLTVSTGRNIDCFGSPSTEFSWFPGYAWIIANCRKCHAQLGWKFTSNKLVPNEFWGLAKKCIAVNIINPDKETI